MTRRWEGWTPSTPLRVEGGLAARSTRGAIGETWWSKRFLAVLESFGAGGRLTRGKAYARKGQVLSLEVTPGVVRGAVQGSRATPYEVWITFPIISAAVWTRVETQIGRQALFAAHLLGGELPAELEQVIADAGGQLFPGRFEDLSMRCTCPDWGLPCKHLAAAFYLLAETFDDDPFRILLWRGRSRDQLLAGLRSEVPSDSPDAGLADQRTRPEGSAGELSDLPATTAEELLDRFWVSPVPLPPRPPAFEAPADLLLRQLAGPPPSLGGAPVAQALQRDYERFSAAADLLFPSD